MSHPFCPAHPNPDCPKEKAEGVCEHCGFDFEQQHLDEESLRQAEARARQEVWESIVRPAAPVDKDKTPTPIHISNAAPISKAFQQPDETIHELSAEVETMWGAKRYRWLEIDKDSRAMLFWWLASTQPLWLMLFPKKIFGFDLIHQFREIAFGNPYLGALLVVFAGVLGVLLFAKAGVLIAVGKIQKLSWILCLAWLGVVGIGKDLWMSFYLISIALVLVWTIVPRSGYRGGDFFRYVRFLNSWDKP